jgi:hypothetical protein
MGDRSTNKLMNNLLIFYFLGDPINKFIVIFFILDIIPLKLNYVAITSAFITYLITH